MTGDKGILPEFSGLVRRRVALLPSSQARRSELGENGRGAEYALEGPPWRPALQRDSRGGPTGLGWVWPVGTSREGISLAAAPSVKTCTPGFTSLSSSAADSREFH